MFLTDFADAAVTMPLAALVLAVLLLASGRRAALAWTGAVGAAFATILALKLLFGVTHVPGIASPSGHTAGATVVYAGLLRVLGAGRVSTAAAAATVAAIVAATRLVLGVHSPPEVVIGAMVGFGGVVLLVRSLPSAPFPGPAARSALIAAAATVMVLTHGQHAPFELMLRNWCACINAHNAGASPQTGRSSLVLSFKKEHLL